MSFTSSTLRTGEETDSQASSSIGAAVPEAVALYLHIAGLGAQEGAQVRRLPGEQLSSFDGQPGSSGDGTFIRNEILQQGILNHNMLDIRYTFILVTRYHVTLGYSVLPDR